jgi:hypothetical protein
MGKILAERGDVQEGIDTAYLAGGEGRRLFKVGLVAERNPIGVRSSLRNFRWRFPPGRVSRAGVW